MPVRSAAQRVALMKKQAEVGLARNFERKPDEECKETEELKAKVEAAKKPAKSVPEDPPGEVPEEGQEAEVTDASKPDDEQSDQ